jgi:hypothetical protein
MNEKNLMKQMAKFLEKHYGKRCTHFAAGCSICEVWRSYDYIFMPWSPNSERAWEKHCKVKP